jgi:hypothetical protein
MLIFIILLPTYNEGWKPEWDGVDDKWCIHRVKSDCMVSKSIHNNMLLSFETKEKADLFLKEKINLVVDLSNAGYI